MARVLIPMHPRTYNHNPKGSATAVVTMKGANPFESRNFGGPQLHRLANRQIAGVGSLGDDPVVYGPPAPAATPAPAPASPGINWAGIATAVSTAVTPLVPALANRWLPTHNATPIPGQAPVPLPIGYQPPAAHKSKTPYIIGGVAVVGLIGLLIFMRRR